MCIGNVSDMTAKKNSYKVYAMYYIGNCSHFVRILFKISNSSVLKYLREIMAFFTIRNSQKAILYRAKMLEVLILWFGVS